MPGDRFFVDSNVILYSLGNDLAKKLVATTLLAGNSVVSTQVLMETANVARRKLGYSVGQIRAVLKSLTSVCEVSLVTEAMIERSLDIAERYGFSTYDSLIVATALEAGCVALYTEDLHRNQRIDRLTIVNSFLVS